MRKYTNHSDIVQQVKQIKKKLNLVLDGNPELEIASERMFPGSYESFYFNIISEDARPVRRGIWFEVTRHQDGFYSLHYSFNW